MTDKMIEIISDNIKDEPNLYKMFLTNDNVRTAILERCAYKFLKNYRKEPNNG